MRKVDYVEKMGEWGKKGGRKKKIMIKIVANNTLLPVSSLNGYQLQCRPLMSIFIYCLLCFLGRIS